MVFPPFNIYSKSDVVWEIEQQQNIKEICIEEQNKKVHLWTNMRGPKKCNKLPQISYFHTIIQNARWAVKIMFICRIFRT